MSTPPAVKETSHKSIPIVRGGRQSKLLTEPVLLEEENVPQFVRIALAAAAASVVLFLVWATFVHIDEVSAAPGQVVPSASVKIIQHLEGGSVSDILISEGEKVATGQTLIRMDPALAKSELDQMRARQAGLTVRAERLKAVVDHRQPDFDQLRQEYPDIVADQERIWSGQLASQRSALQVLDSQVDQKKREISQLREALGIAERHLKLTKDQLKIREDGAAEGIVSRQILLETRRAEVTSEGELYRLREQIKVATDQLSESERRRSSLDLTQQQDALNELGTVTAEIEQVKNALTKLQDRVDRLEIKSPTAGYIQDLKVRTPGEVIPAGGVLLRIVPVNDELEAEVRIQPSDIGHVHVGQHVRVKLVTYDYTRYGAMPATLVKISATTFVDEQSKPYYKGTIALDRSYLGPGEGQNPVLPGMSVEADIVTGEKRLIEYLLKPVFVSLKNSFHER
jgi:adhesin transport system membrane fusion protein